MTHLKYKQIEQHFQGVNYVENILRTMAKKYSRNPFNIILYYISRFYHLYPLKFDFYKKNKFRNLHRFSMTILAFSLVGIFVWNYKMKHSFFYEYVDTSYSAMEISLNLSLTLFNISCTVLVQKSNQWKALLNPVFKNVKNRKHVKNNSIFYLMHIIQIAWTISEVYICITYNMSILAPIFLSLIDKINIYMVQISSLLMNGYVSCMVENVASVKVGIQREIVLLKRLKAIEKNDLAAFEKFISTSEIDDILNFTVQVLKGIDAFNEIYGVQILGLSGIIMMFITNTCNSVMNLTVGLVVVLCVKSYFSIALLVSGFRVFYNLTFI